MARIIVIDFDANEEDLHNILFSELLFKEEINIEFPNRETRGIGKLQHDRAGEKRKNLHKKTSKKPAPKKPSAKNNPKKRVSKKPAPKPRRKMVAKKNVALKKTTKKKAVKK